MQQAKFWIKLLPLAIGVVILVVIAILSPWRQIGGLLERLSWQELIVLTVLSAGYYLSKAGRFWLMLRFLDIRVAWGPAILAYIAAQPVTVLPAGELYRSVLLKRYAGVPVRRSSPTVTVQGLVEAVLLLAAALAGALVVGHYRGAVLGTALALAATILVLRRGWLKDQHRLFNRLPFIELSRRYYNQFILSHRQLLRRPALGWLVLASVPPVGIGIVLLFMTAAAMDVPVSWPAAAIAYSLPVVLSGLSFLPGGIGTNEGSSIGVLRLAGATTASAIAITLIVRVFTLGAGVVYGLIGLAIAGLTQAARYDNSDEDEPLRQKQAAS